MLHLLIRALAWLVLTPIFLLLMPRPWLLAPDHRALPVHNAQWTDQPLREHVALRTATLPSPKLPRAFAPLREPSPTRVITVVISATAPLPQAALAALAQPESSTPFALIMPSTTASQVNTDWLNLRAGPSQVYPVVTVADFGTPLTVTGRSADCTWLQAHTATGVTGWVLAAYVTQASGCDPLPIIATEPPPPAVGAATIIAAHAPLPAAVTETSNATTGLCTPIPNEHYDLLTIEGGPTERPAAQHPDMNLAVRGFTPTQTELAVIEFDAADDLAAPQLRGLFGDGRTPALAAVYQVYDWDWGCDCRGAPLAKRGASLAGLAVQPGEIIYTPDSGRGIGSGYEVLVLYATENEITLKYTREDNVISGYTLHLADLCVEPRLLALYRAADQAGRQQLPALRAGQAVGQALGAELKLAIRDTGDFMDPRDREDWWRER